MRSIAYLVPFRGTQFSLKLRLWAGESNSEFQISDFIFHIGLFVVCSA